MKAFLTLLVLAVISAGVFALGTMSKKGGDKSLLHVAADTARDGVGVATAPTATVWRAFIAARR